MTVSQGEALKRIGRLFAMPKPRAEKCKALFDLAREARGGCIVEVGAATGTGAIALAYGARKGVKVYAIDDYLDRVGWATEPYTPENKIAFIENTEAAGVTVHLVHADARKAVQVWSKPIALLHWDLGMYSEMVDDFWQWEPHMVSGGVIAVHDTLDRRLGSRELEKQAATSGKFEPAEHLGGGVWAFRKR